MGTVVSISIYSQTEPPLWHTHVDSAFSRMARLERLTTVYDSTSQISGINRAAGMVSLEVDPEIVELLYLSKEVGEASNGAFDVTISPLLDVWRFHSDTPRVPALSEIQAHLGAIDFRKISVSGSTATLADAGMAIDLGGIAKGYAVDLAVDELLDDGYTDFMVEAGGDLRAVASDLTRGERNIWIQHPRHPDKFFASIKMDAGAVATSGDYERYFEEGGKRYHHILNPQTGFPAGPNVSVTIFAGTTAIADAYSTAVFVLGPEAGLQLIEQTPGLEGVIIYEENSDGKLKWVATKNIKKKLKIIKDDK